MKRIQPCHALLIASGASGQKRRGLINRLQLPLGTWVRS